MMSSTPGGIEMGMRPSFDGRAVVAEKGRVNVAVVVDGVGAWNAGTRKPGNVTTDARFATVGDDEAANTLVRTGAASIFCSRPELRGNWCEGGRHEKGISNRFFFSRSSASRTRMIPRGSAWDLAWSLHYALHTSIIQLLLYYC